MNKFVLCPARHNHPSIDGLSSIFEETDDIFNLKFTKKFEEYMSGCNYPELEVYITGLTPAYDKLMKRLNDWEADHNGSYEKYNVFILKSMHFDRNTNEYRTI